MRRIVRLTKDREANEKIRQRNWKARQQDEEKTAVATAAEDEEEPNDIIGPSYRERVPAEIFAIPDDMARNVIVTLRPFKPG
jgi:hypothetical protein